MKIIAYVCFGCFAVACYAADQPPPLPPHLASAIVVAPEVSPTSREGAPRRCEGCITCPPGGCEKALSLDVAVDDDPCTCEKNRAAIRRNLLRSKAMAIELGKLRARVTLLEEALAGAGAVRHDDDAAGIATAPVLSWWNWPDGKVIQASKHPRDWNRAGGKTYSFRVNCADGKCKTDYYWVPNGEQN